MHTYTIELPRSAEFPLDMLRYDGAAGATSDDDTLIAIMEDLERDRSDLPPRVRITLRSPDRFSPHVKRWNSFGVDVVESDNPYTAPSELMIAARGARARGKIETLSITKRDEDAYDVTDGQRRIAAIRGEPGAWNVRWEGAGPNPAPQTFHDAHRAFQELVARVLA
jgi:hypothetical protein